MSVNRDQAREALAKLVSADTAPTLDHDDLNAALTAALVAAPDGRLPGAGEYVETFSLAWAASVAMETRATRAAASAAPALTKVSADGATFERAEVPASHWLDLARRFREMAARDSGDSLNVVEIVREGSKPWPVAPAEAFWPWSPVVTTEPLIGPTP